MSLRRKILYGFTLAVLAVLLLLPTTGWLVRIQLLPFTLPSAPHLLYSSDDSWEERYDASSSQAVAKSGNDFTLQYAYALSDGFEGKGSSETLQRLEKLNEAYPQKPVLIAAILKTMTSNIVIGWRQEENLLSTPEHRVVPDTKNKQCDPAQLARFIALAEAGEKLEPQNAYFAVMTARGYFLAKQDGKAVAAWIRAGEKPKWNDYYTSEIAAKWKLQRAVNGGREIGTAARMASQATTFSPHYAGIRSSARMASVIAFRAELQADKEAGFAIRRATRRIGQNIQANSKSYLGNLIGNTVITTVTSRVGGEETTTDHGTNEVALPYATYLRSIGHPEEAATYLKAKEDSDLLKPFFTQAHTKTYMRLSTKTDQLLGGWLASFFLISGILFSLTYAGIFKLVYKFSPRLQKGEPLQKSARWGVATGLGLPFVVGVVAVSTDIFGVKSGQSTLFAVVAGVSLLLVPPFLLRFSLREVGHGLLVMLATWGALFALVVTGIACKPFLQSVSNLLGMIAFVASGEDAENVIKNSTPQWLGKIVAYMPLGLMVLFGIFSKILRVPFAAGVTRGMRAMAVPLACVLTLLWSGAFLYTYHHESAAIREMEQMVAVGERQYLQQISTDVSAK